MKPTKRVVFVSNFPVAREFKLASGLKRLGWEVYLTSKNAPGFSDRSSFSACTRFSSEDDLIRLCAEIKPDICHVFTTYDYSYALFLLQYLKEIPVVFDPYDLITGIFKDDFINQNSWLSNNVSSELYCLEHADGVCCRHLETQCYKHAKMCQFKNKRVLVLEGCLNESHEYVDKIDPGGIHVVAVGGMYVEKNCPEYKGMGGNLWVAHKLLEAGLYFHVYPTPNCYTNGFEEDLSDYIELEKQTNGQFRLHRNVPYENLVQEISQYHIGLNVNSSIKDINLDLLPYHERKQTVFEYAIGNRLFDYLDAGLPIIAEPAMFKWFVRSLKKQGVVLDADPLLYSDTAFFNFEEYDVARKRTLSAAQYFSTYKQTEKLNQYYLSLIHKKKSEILGSSIIQKSTLLNDMSSLSSSGASAAYERIFALKEAENQKATTIRLLLPVPVASPPEKKCVFLNSYYTAFLTKTYQDNLQLASLPYNVQLEVLQKECFGDSDFYSQGIEKAGWQASDLIVNCQELQLAWARENNFVSSDLTSIMLKQLENYRPTVVYFQDPFIATSDVLSEIRRFASLLVLQIASPIPQHINFSSFDIVFTAAPHFVEIFRKQDVASYYQALAFDPRCVVTAPLYQSRSIDVSFVGGFSSLHVARYELFDYLAHKTSILFWGYGAPSLPEGSAVRTRHQGEVWGKGMFQILKNSKITVNRHIEIAENYACNMRLYEATGAGALLVTEYKDNLNELFEIGKEVVAYRSKEECAELINYYLEHPEEAEKIARAGQLRTLRDHIYSCRMAQTAEILERHLRYSKEANLYAAPNMSAISAGHESIARTDVTLKMTSAWQESGIPVKQRALVQHSLSRMYRGEDMGEYRILGEVLRPLLAYSGTSVLEIGCSSGYVYEIIEYLLGKRIDYTGCDYSKAMIAMAKDYYPRVNFFTADGANLFFADRQFHVVISSCILLHVPNYREHIFETARVADRFIVASRTPVCKKRPTQFLKKYAYGVETVELIFNEDELVREFILNRFELVKAEEYDTDPDADLFHTTYLFRRG